MYAVSRGIRSGRGVSEVAQMDHETLRTDMAVQNVRYSPERTYGEMFSPTYSAYGMVKYNTRAKTRVCIHIRAFRYFHNCDCFCFHATAVHRQRASNHHGLRQIAGDFAECTMGGAGVPNGVESARYVDQISVGEFRGRSGKRQLRLAWSRADVEHQSFGGQFFNGGRAVVARASV